MQNQPSWRERLKRIHYPFAIAILYQVAVLMLAVSEIPYIHAKDVKLWLSFKVISALFGIPALIATYKRQENDFIIGFFFFTGCFQVLTSGLFRPLYEIGYFQVAMAAAFINTRNKWIYAVIFGIGAIFISTLHFWRGLLGITLDPISYTDLAVATFLFFFIAAAIYYIFANIREERSVQNMRLSLLGQHSIQLAHDLKGLLSGPLLHVSALQARTDEVSQAELKNVIAYLKEDLANASRVLSQMSEMSRNRDEVMELDLKRTIDSVMILFQRRFANAKVEIDIAAKIKIKTDPRRFQFILFNAFLNCAEQMGRRTPGPTPDPTQPHIRVTYKDSVLRIEDNCGGMRDDILKILKAGGAATSKTSGGGLGFQIIQGEARALKLALELQNTEKLGGRGFSLRLGEIKSI